MKLFERVSTDYAIIAVLVCIAICARFVSFGYFSSLAAGNPSAVPYPIVSGDSEHYAHLANSLLTLHAYEEVPGIPFRSWPPGYPIVLAGIKALTGSMTAIVIVQTLFAALAVSLIYRIGRTLVPTVYATIPALVYAIDPMVVFSDTSIRTDGIFASLLVLIVYIAFFDRRLSGIMRWGLVGLLLGMATLIRPIAEFLVLVFPAMYLFREWIRGESNGPRWKAVGAFVAGCILVLSPWMVHNQVRHGSFEISNLGAHNLLMNHLRGFLAWRALAATNPMPAFLVLRHVDDPVFATVDTKIATDLADLTPQGENTENYEGQLAARYIMRDPVRYAYFHAVNTIPFFLSSSAASYQQNIRQLRDNQAFYAPIAVSLLETWARIRHPENLNSFANAVWSIVPTALEIVWWLLVTLTALAALVLRRRDLTVLLCAVLVVYFAALTGPLSNSRYRIPAEPYLVLLAVVGAHAITGRVRDSYKRAIIR